MNHLFNMDMTTFRVLQCEIVELLGEHKMCPFMNLNMVSLDFMWKNGYRVIVFSPFTETIPTIFWSPAMISSPWPDTNNVDILLDFLDSNLEHRRYNPLGFFVSQGVCTPKNSDIIRRWRSTLRSSFSLRTNRKMLEWLDKLSKEKQLKVNIVILDFVEEEYSRKIISLNHFTKC
ncbi:hypothetical protein KIN20_001758 [Parelaphostrongylus tenuis]|uniref:Uncharacterized protein n=1 Tax=Parelaphostrongylus tenuis TaxID=148309 RepID=A0AAD5LYU1_PARTN|nr:hypothetical protein KIN20_001758 [Parelaphostrongylus tenuis]